MPDAVEALKACGMLIDCIFLLFSPEQMAIQAAGTRVLTAVEPPELLARMLPTKELREKVEIASNMLSRAKVMRITSSHGTDVTYRLNTYPTVAEYACTDQPGRWDHWPSGFVFTGGGTTTASMVRSWWHRAISCFRRTSMYAIRSPTRSKRVGSPISVAGSMPNWSNRTWRPSTIRVDVA